MMLNFKELYCVTVLSRYKFDFKHHFITLENVTNTYKY